MHVSSGFTIVGFQFESNYEWKFYKPLQQIYRWWEFRWWGKPRELYIANPHYYLPSQPGLPHVSIITESITQARMTSSSHSSWLSWSSGPLLIPLQCLSFLSSSISLTSHIPMALHQSPCLWPHLPLTSFCSTDRVMFFQKSTFSLHLPSSLSTAVSKLINVPFPSSIQTY